MSVVTRSHEDQVVTQKVPSARPRWAAGDGQRVSTSDFEAAYETFFRTHFTNLTRTIHLIVHDRARAEDIAQDAFLQLFRRDWPRIAAYERPEAWLRRAAIRLALRGLRRDALWSKVRGLFLPRPARTAADPDVLEAVGRLPRAQRVGDRPPLLRGSRPVAEIAAFLGCGGSIVTMSTTAWTVPGRATR